MKKQFLLLIFLKTIHAHANELPQWKTLARERQQEWKSSIIEATQDPKQTKITFKIEKTIRGQICISQSTHFKKPWWAWEYLSELTSCDLSIWFFEGDFFWNSNYVILIEPEKNHNPGIFVLCDFKMLNNSPSIHDIHQLDKLLVEICREIGWKGNKIITTEGGFMKIGEGWSLVFNSDLTSANAIKEVQENK